MPKFKRTLAVQLLQALDFNTASALSTHRLEKKVNRIDRIHITPAHQKALTEQQSEHLEFILNALANNQPIVIEEDRPNVPEVEKTKSNSSSRWPAENKKGKPQKEPRTKSEKFDNKKSKKYDWQTLLNGPIFELEKGVDYFCSSNNFALQARAAARRRGHDANISSQGDKVIVQGLPLVSRPF